MVGRAQMVSLELNIERESTEWIEESFFKNDVYTMNVNFDVVK